MAAVELFLGFNFYLICRGVGAPLNLLKQIAVFSHNVQRSGLFLDVALFRVVRR